MGYTVEYPDFKKALQSAGEFTYALVYDISRISLSHADALKEKDWSQTTEARFFSEDKELHLFFGADPYAVLVKDKDADGVLVKEYFLANKFRDIGTAIRVKQYIEADCDGQMQIKLTRLAGVQ